jgi:5-keto 4-deoxyuronate isomerase
LVRFDFLSQEELFYDGKMSLLVSNHSVIIVEGVIAVNRKKMIKNIEVPISCLQAGHFIQLSYR